MAELFSFVLKKQHNSRADRQTDIKGRGSLEDRQTYRQTKRWADKQADRQATGRQAGGQVDRQMARETSKQVVEAVPNYSG